MPEDTYKVRVKEFEGPLEILLELIESQKLSINEISLASVAQDYFEFLKNIKESKNETYYAEIASFLVIASTLILIKSRSLLPCFYVTKEEAADIKELEDRLIMYKKIKEMAASLQSLSQNRRELFTREPRRDLAPSFLPPKRLETDTLLRHLKNMIAGIPKKVELPQRIVKKIISIEEKIKELEGRIREGVVKTFHEFLGGKKEKTEIIVSFLAMLELMKNGVIMAQQSNLFGHIHFNNETGKNT